MARERGLMARPKWAQPVCTRADRAAWGASGRHPRVKGRLQLGRIGDRPIRPGYSRRSARKSRLDRTRVGGRRPGKRRVSALMYSGRDSWSGGRAARVSTPAAVSDRGHGRFGRGGVHLDHFPDGPGWRPRSKEAFVMAQGS